MNRKSTVTTTGRVEWHIPEAEADWTAHVVGPDCWAHVDAAERGEAPYGGHIESRPPPPPGAPEWPPSIDRPRD
jgi:hypothetical protein